MARNKRGSTRKLRSGRYQARYTGPDGIQYKAQTTFPDELAALGWLASIRQTIDLDTWQPPEIAPRVRKVPTVGEMVQLWLTQSKAEGGPDPGTVDTSGVSYAALVSVADVSASKSSGARRLHHECRRRVL
ncbi:hypothetical protein CKF74_04560 [Corynebacterium striatum]|nr:hypothetical protein CKF74_04560 [Corynebacterium striatum]